MQQCSSIIEADVCRLLANELTGRPEEAVSLRLANEFDRMAGATLIPGTPTRDVFTYYLSRERQELSAADRAISSGARRAHLALATRYGRWAHSLVLRAPRAGA